MKLFKTIFSNNGVARGLLYFSIAAGTPLVAQFTEWDETAPKTYYAIAASVIAALVAGLVAIRAFIDQHLSSNPPAGEENKPVTVPVTMQVDPQNLQTEVIPPSNDDNEPAKV